MENAPCQKVTEPRIIVTPARSDGRSSPSSIRSGVRMSTTSVELRSHEERHSLRPVRYGSFTDLPRWGDFDLTQDAARLKGRLLLAYAGLDENAYPAEAARMISALTEANKSFDLIYMPNGSHAFSEDPYFIRRRWDFFVRNLFGATPPTNYVMRTFEGK